MAKKKSSSRQQMNLFGGEESEKKVADGSTKTTSRTKLQAKSGTSAKTSPAVTVEPLETPDGKLVAVLDSHALLYQVFHAMPPMSSPSSLPVGAVYGFLRDVLDLIEKLKPDFFYCAFDRGSVTFRNEIYKDYKANRDPMPDDLRPQIGYVQSLLNALNIPILELDNYEADDIMATLAKRAEDAGGRCLVITGDKDCRQLITEKVKIYNPRKAIIYDETHLEKDWGIRPDQVVDFQSLVGDPTDNVPGVHLIGPKLAKQLLNDFDTLEGVFENVDSVSGKKRKENLTNGKEAALMSRRLVRLDPEVPIEIDWRHGQIGGADVGVAAGICKEFGFRQLTGRVQRLADSILAGDQSPRNADQNEKARKSLEDLGGDASGAALTLPEAVEKNYQLIQTEKELSALVKKLSKAEKIALDTETTSTRARDAQLVGVSVSWHPGQAAYIPVMAPEGQKVFDWETLVRPALEPVFCNDKILKIGQNIKYDLLILKNHGLDVQGTLFDTMVADFLLTPGRAGHSIADLASKFLGEQATSIKTLIGTGKNQLTMDQVDLQDISPYACEDADFAYRLENPLRKELESGEFEELFFQLEMPLLRVLTEMEYKGIRLDASVLEEFSQVLQKRMEGLKEEIYQAVDQEFNLDSPKQLAEILFEKLELPVIKKTKTGASTDMEVLTELAQSYEFPQKIIQYRQAAKLKSTYSDSLPTMVVPCSGRIHTSFMQDVAATGRLSSKDPNLQNIPIRTEDGRKIRKAFVPGSEGWKLLMADYSQVELRMLAHFSRDPALQKAFESGADIHTSVAAEVFQVDLEDVDKDQRRRAKAINFGIIYGQSAFGLSKGLGISREDASQFIDHYFERYPRVLEFMEKTLDQARANGSVKTILGRCRPVEGVRDKSHYRSRNMPERVAINTVIQGSAADLIKLAMLRVARAVQDSDLQAQMLLQIHDELVFETPESELDDLAQLVEKEMCQAYPLDVPLKVDVEFGDNWNDCEAWVAK